MRLIKPTYKIIEQEAGLNGIFKQIELAGRTCYKSEDKITENSSKEFVERMTKSGHGAMLEHGTVYIKLTTHYQEGLAQSWELKEHRGNNKVVEFYKNNKYSKVITGENWTHYITTNYRVLVENNRLDDLRLICEPTEYHEKRHTVKFVCDRGVSHEYVRHRVFSFAQESTRYCNYSKDKFDNEITYIIPCWLNIEEGIYQYLGYVPFFEKIINDNDNITITDDEIISYLHPLWTSSVLYLSLINDNKWIAQQARSVLPNSLKTELIMTGFVSDWKHFFSLRDAGSAHPQARELAQPLHEEFITKNYI